MRLTALLASRSPEGFSIESVTRVHGTPGFHIKTIYMVPWVIVPHVGGCLIGTCLLLQHRESYRLAYNKSHQKRKLCAA